MVIFVPPPMGPAAHVYSNYPSILPILEPTWTIQLIPFIQCYSSHIYSPPHPMPESELTTLFGVPQLLWAGTEKRKDGKTECMH